MKSLTKHLIKSLVRSIMILLLPLCLLAQSWELVWQDEFDDAEINEEYWSWDTAGNAWDWGNNEDQYYTAGRSENSRIENGNLIIEARKEEWEGKEYTSARLRTYKKASWLYGKVEVRAKLSGGKGSWPAFWMLPEDDFYGGWPNSGEIDIMEYVGFEEKTIYSTIHTEAYNHDINTHKGDKITVENITDSFHLYSVEWYPDSMSFFVDSNHVFTFTPEDKSKEKWPFNKPFHFLMNVAIGGDWGGLQGIDDAIFPIQMAVDYVRVYKQVDTPVKVEVLSHGEGTVSISPEKETYTIGETITLTATPGDKKEFLQWNGTKTTTENPFTYVVQGHASFGATFRTAGELLKNGNFADSMANWEFYVSKGSATAQVTDTGAVIEISQSGENPWDIQMGQKKLSLEKGKSYIATATISSSDSIVFTMGVGMSKDPWENYLSEKVIINKEKKEVTFSFTMEESDPEGRIYFDLGDSKGALVLHDVSLKDKSIIPVIPAAKTSKTVSTMQLRGRKLILGHEITEGTSLSLVNAQGRTILQKNSVSAGELIPLLSKSIANGIYYVRLINDGAVVDQQRVVVR